MSDRSDTRRQRKQKRSQTYDRPGVKRVSDREAERQMANSWRGSNERDARAKAAAEDRGDVRASDNGGVI